MTFFFSVDFDPIGTKLGRKVEGVCEKELRALVSIATKVLSWYSIKTALYP